MTVTLERHIGRHAATGRDIDLGQAHIFVDDRHVGYVKDGAGMPVCLVFQELPAVKEAIVAHLTQLNGKPPRTVAEPPPINHVIDAE